MNQLSQGNCTAEGYQENQTSARDHEVQNRKFSLVLSAKHHPAADIVQIPQKLSVPFGYLPTANHSGVLRMSSH